MPGTDLIVQLDADNSEIVLFERRRAEGEEDSRAQSHYSMKSTKGSAVESTTPSKQVLLTRKSLKRLRMLPRLSSKERFAPPEVTEKMDRLADMISDRKLRQELVMELLSNKSDCSIKVRFVAAVEEYERTVPRVERKAKGYKIVSMFVQNGSMFQLSGIPSHLMQVLLSGKLDKLIELKNFVLEDLVQNSMVAKLMKELLPKRIILSYTVPS